MGSIFFTSAAVLQYQQSETDAPVTERRGLRAALRAMARRDDRWASAVQLIGTLCFNLSTFAATRAVATVQQERRLIWSPDLAGSVCFLLASAAGCAIAMRAARRLPRLIAGLNLAGSVAFGAAAIGARYLRTDGEIANIELVNLGTFLGAVCFFAGAALLPVDSARSDPTSGGPSSPVVQPGPGA